MKKVLQLTFLALSMIFLSACSPKTPKPNSIISDPSILKPVPDKDNVFYYLNKDFNANDYRYVIVPEIKINVEKEDEKNVDKKLLKQIATYYQQNLQKELSKVLSKNRTNNGLIMEVSIASLNVSYDELKPWEYLPYGLAIKAIARGTTLETRKLNTVIAIKLSDKKTKISQIIVVDNKVEDDIESYDEFTFKNVKPLLDSWIKNSKEKLQELNDHKYKY